jgi:hypothetical protein
MRTINRVEFPEWCRERSLELVDREWPNYREVGRHTFLVKLPDTPYRAVALARLCFPRSYEAPFHGAMIWFRDWGIWSDVDEATGMFTLQRLRGAHGETRPLIEAPGHIFTGGEFADARAFWTLPMIFGWDAILFPEQNDYFVLNSHDEVVSFVSRSKETHSQLIEEFKDWNPEESDWYFR